MKKWMFLIGFNSTMFIVNIILAFTIGTALNFIASGIGVLGIIICVFGMKNYRPTKPKEIGNGNVE